MKKWSVTVTLHTKNLLKLPVRSDPSAVLRIALVGGQATGKSTLLRAIRGIFADRAICVPEVARMVRNDIGFTPKDEEGIRFLQTSIYEIQVNLENLALRHAIQSRLRCVVSDRTRYDGIAYLAVQDYVSAVQQFEHLCREEKLIWDLSYDFIFYFQMPPKSVYEHRRPGPGHSSYEVAKHRADLLLQVWEHHPGFVVLPADDGNGEQELFALEQFRRLMIEPVAVKDRQETAVS